MQSQRITSIIMGVIVIVVGLALRDLFSNELLNRRQPAFVDEEVIPVHIFGIT